MMLVPQARGIVLWTVACSCSLPVSFHPQIAGGNSQYPGLQSKAQIVPTCHKIVQLMKHTIHTNEKWNKPTVPLASIRPGMKLASSN